MPLQSSDTAARDEGAAVSFTMADGTRPVRCSVQQGALDAAGPARTVSAPDRLERFRRHRVEFEAVASDLYDARLPIRITADHVTSRRRLTGNPGRMVA